MEEGDCAFCIFKLRFESRLCRICQPSFFKSDKNKAGMTGSAAQEEREREIRVERFAG